MKYPTDEIKKQGAKKTYLEIFMHKESKGQATDLYTTLHIMQTSTDFKRESPFDDFEHSK